ncbi:MAG: hypothetical protein HYU64_05915 [Armatimonadetes bacterium]|nr:hypothetical protein [Armatimonadota bacterium]
MIQLPPLEAYRVQSFTAQPIAKRPEKETDPYYRLEGYPTEKFLNLKDAVGHIDPPEGKYVAVYQYNQQDLMDKIGCFAEGLLLGGLMGATLGIIAGFVTGAIFGPSAGLKVGSSVAVLGGVGMGILNCNDEYHAKKYQGYLVNKPFSHEDGTKHEHLTWVSLQGCSSIETLLSDLTASVEQDQGSPKTR